MTRISTLISAFLKLYNYDFSNKSLISIITKELPSELSLSLTYPDNLKMKGNVGRIQPADIPWVAIMDTEITQTTREGYYIGLLFSPHTQAMTLGLCVGWVYFEKKYRNYNQRLSEYSKHASYLSDQIVIAEHGFTRKRPSLLARQPLSKGYEYSSNFTKEYTQETIMTEDVVQDIQYLLGLYHTIKLKVGADFWTH